LLVAAAALSEVVAGAVGEIREVCGSYDCVYVMFSGGRDSLVTLDLSVRALGGRVRALFIDTGVATPGLRDYVVEVCRGYGVELAIVNSGYDFFELVLRKGFPMIRYRWCKEYLKMKPLKRFVESAKKECNGLLLVTGVRREESWVKSRASKLYDHPQLGVKVYAPIFEWSGELVKEYIKAYGLKQNPLYALYGKAYDCWCTVYKTPADFATLALIHPEFFEKFVEAESKLRSGGSALYYNGEKIYLRDIKKNPAKYLEKYARTYRCPICKIFT